MFKAWNQRENTRILHSKFTEESLFNLEINFFKF